MNCKRCKVKMREEKRSFHKQRKWVCPLCGKARMQAAGAGGRRRKQTAGDEADGIS